MVTAVGLALVALISTMQETQCRIGQVLSVEHGRRYAYVFLTDKTFLNAQMIQRGTKPKNPSRSRRLGGSALI